MCFSKTPALSPTRRLPALLRPGRRHHARRGHRHGRAQAPRRRRARRRPHLRRDPRHRLALATAAPRASTRPVPAGQARGAAPRLRRRPATAPTPSSWSRPTAPAPRPATPPSSAALTQVFGEAGASDRQWCALGSVKSQIGHTKAAAGAAGLFKAVLALHHKVLPPTIKVDRPEPDARRSRAQPVLPQHPTPAVDPRRASHPRRASVSSFGFGGTNFHVALEEYTGPRAQAPRLRSVPTRAGGAHRRDGPDGVAVSAARCRRRGAGGLPRVARALDAGSRSTPAPPRAGCASSRRGRRALAEKLAQRPSDRHRPTALHRAGGIALRRRAGARVASGLPVPRAGQPVPRHGRRPGDAASTPRGARGTVAATCRCGDAPAAARRGVPAAGLRRRGAGAAPGHADRHRVGAAGASARPASRCCDVLASVGRASPRASPATASAR